MDVAREAGEAVHGRLVWLGIIVMLAGGLVVPAAPNPLPGPTGIPHAPIKIGGDADFTPANGVVGGSGTSADPYVIAGWDIDATASHGIDIQNTTASFVIRDTSVRSSPSTLDYTGIRMVNALHAVLENVTVEDVLDGVFAEYVEDIRILRSEISRAGHYGIFLRYTADMTVEGNTVRGSGVLNTIPGLYVYDGLAVYGAQNLTVLDNRFFDNDHNGVDAILTPDISVHDNTFEGNRGGISVWEAGNITVYRNTVSNQSGNGIDFVAVKNVTVEDNRVSNTLWGISFSGNLGYPDLTNEGVTVRRNLLTGIWVGMGFNSILAPSVTDNVLLGGTNPGMTIEFVEDGLFTGNVIAGTDWDGVVMYRSNDTVFRGNNVSGNVNRGIWAFQTLNLTLVENRVAANGFGISLEGSNGALVHRNLLQANGVQAEDDAAATNTWDDGYPSGGNWWSDYGGVDQCSGPLQNVCPDPDGIGDTPYVIDADSEDRYPLWTPADLPPHAAFTVTPASGTIATIFDFDANASWDPNEPAAALEVRWDWEDDGTWDTAFSTMKTASHSYATPGSYAVRMEVRDSTGLTNDTTRSVAVVNTPPTAALSVSPSLGGLMTSFTANASASTDFEDASAALEVRWDWEDDGTWDTGWSAAKTAGHVYGSAGVYAIRVEVRDTDGGTDQETAAVTVVPDPVTSLVLGTPNATAGGTFVTSSTPLSFAVSDPGGTGIRNTTYRDDGGPWVNYTATGPFSLSGEGAHLLEFRSEDFVGNVEETRNATLVVDDTPPETSLQVGSPNVTGGQVFVTSGTPFTLSAIDGGATPVGLGTIEYRVDSGPWLPYATPFTLPTGDGPRTVFFRATDLLGNAETEVAVAVVLDDTPPATTIQVGSPSFLSGDQFVTSATPFTVASSDAGVGVAGTEFRVDGGSWTPYTAPFALGAGEGSRSIEVRSQDALGNLEAASTLAVVVDDTPPSTDLLVGTPRYDGAERYVTSATPFTLTAADGGALPAGVEGTEFRIGDGGSWSAWTAYAGAFTLPPGDGARDLEVRSVDRLGNEEVAVSTTVVLDDTPPETSIAPGGRTQALGTSFTLNASDAGSGVQGTEFRVDDGDWTPYEGAFTLTEGEHIVRFRSEDRVSNVEPEHVETLVVAAEPNYKPLFAAVMAVVLAVVGALAARRNPRHGTWVRTWMLRTLPFVLAEAATGAVSALTGWLSIPPILGLGMAVDLGIVVAGLILAVVGPRAVKDAEPADPAPGAVASSEEAPESES